MSTNIKVKEWYEKNAEQYNAERRKRYASDEEQRKMAQERASAYRAARAKGQEIKRVLHRTAGLYNDVVYSTGQLAEYVGVSAQCIRNWHKRGWLPPTVFGGKHRLYTTHQAMHVKRLAQWVHAEGKGQSMTREELIEDILQNW